MTVYFTAEVLADDEASVARRVLAAARPEHVKVFSVTRLQTPQSFRVMARFRTSDDLDEAIFRIEGQLQDEFATPEVEAAIRDLDLAAAVITEYDDGSWDEASWANHDRQEEY